MVCTICTSQYNLEGGRELSAVSYLFIMAKRQLANHIQQLKIGSSAGYLNPGKTHWVGRCYQPEGPRKHTRGHQTKCWIMQDWYINNSFMQNKNGTLGVFSVGGWLMRMGQGATSKNLQPEQFRYRAGCQLGWRKREDGGGLHGMQRGLDVMSAGYPAVLSIRGLTSTSSTKRLINKEALPLLMSQFLTVKCELTIVFCHNKYVTQYTQITPSCSLYLFTQRNFSLSRGAASSVLKREVTL